MRFILIIVILVLGNFGNVVRAMDIGEVAATDDVERIELFNGKILINEVSFKDKENDWAQFYVLDDGNGGNGVNLKGFGFFDDRVFKIVEVDFWVKSGDYFVLHFNEDENDQFPNLYTDRKGLVGTTEQLVLRGAGEQVVDFVCWRNGKPSAAESGDFVQFIYTGQWEGADIESCIDSDLVKSGMTIKRSDFTDHNRKEDWNLIGGAVESEEEKTQNSKVAGNDGSLSGDLRISEFLPNPDGTDKGKEWVEIYNFGGGKVDLGNWQLVDGKKSHVLEGMIEAGKVYVVADLSFSLGNSAGVLRLVDFQGKVVDEVEYVDAPSGQVYLRVMGEWKWSRESSPGEVEPDWEVVKGVVVEGPREDDYRFVMETDNGRLEVSFLESVLPYSLAEVMLREGVGVEIEGYKNDRGFVLRSLKNVDDVGSEKSEFFDWWIGGVVILVGGGLEVFRRIRRRV